MSLKILILFVLAFAMVTMPFVGTQITLAQGPYDPTVTIIDPSCSDQQLLPDGSLPLCQSPNTLAFVRDCPALWSPDSTMPTGQIIEAGKTYHVRGVDATGAYVKITFMWGLSVWVAADCLSTPLPTNIVSN